MLVLQSGLPKSGNIWLHKIIQETLFHGGVDQKSFIQSQPIYQEARTWPGFAEQAGIDFIGFDGSGCYYRKGSFQQKITDLDEYLRQCSHVWTHTLWVPACESVFRKFDKIIYIIRDPRDVAVSASRYAFTPFMLAQHPPKEPDVESFLKHRLVEQVLTWVYHIGGYLSRAEEYDIHITFYERLLHDFDTEFSRILAYLDVPISPSAFFEIKEGVRFENMKRNNPHHLRRGESGGWVNVLNPSQANKVARLAGSMMEILSYPIEPTKQGDEWLPSLPENLDRVQLQYAISAARGNFIDKFHYAWEFATSRRSMGEKVVKGIEFLRGKGRWTV